MGSILGLHVLAAASSLECSPATTIGANRTTN
jgi:hypothetical protein